jgi:hypothetical protein
MNAPRPAGFDIVQRPKHYNDHPSGVECIEIIEHMTLNLGNAVKYLWRGGLKVSDPTQDFEKALWYVRREAARMPFLPPSQRQVDMFRSAMAEGGRARRALARPSPWTEPVRCAISFLIDVHCTSEMREIVRLNGRAALCVEQAITDHRQLGQGIMP